MTQVILASFAAGLRRLRVGPTGASGRLRITAVYCSACTGVEKPHLKAFELVFAQYPAAHHGWMIGDSWRADVQAALAVGMRAILVRSEHPEPALQCKTLKEVVGIVEGMEHCSAADEGS